MTWLINELKKTVENIYTPGDPGVVGDPGSPYIPPYTYVVMVESGGGEELSTLAPLWEEIYDFETGETYSVGYRNFSGRRASAAGFLNIGTEEDPEILYIYRYPVVSIPTLVTVPAQPAVPPTPSIPPTPDSVTADNNLGWNSGAIGVHGYLAEDESFRWRFFPGSVGVAIGVRQANRGDTQTYREMRLCAVAMSGRYAVYTNGLAVTSSLPFVESDSFSIRRIADNVLQLVVNGAVIYEQSFIGEVIPDSSLYCGDDVAYDAQIVSSAEIPAISPDDIAGVSISNAVAVGYVTPTFGPGTDRGVIEASSPSDAVIGSVKVNGTIITWASGSSPTDGDVDAHPIPTIGVGTYLGAIASSSASNAVAVEGEYFTQYFGAGNMSFKPMIGAGGAPDVHVGWTGDYPGAATDMLPMQGASENDDIIPVIALGAASFVPMVGSGYLPTGEISTSSEALMHPMIALAYDEDYADGVMAMLPMEAYGTAEQALSGVGSGRFRFVSFAKGFERDPNGGIQYLRNLFHSNGYSGGVARASFSMVSTANGTVSGRGEGRGVIG